MLKANKPTAVGGSVSPEAHRTPYRCLIGTGGVGSGTFFELEGSHTLGREESRAGRYLDRLDYCKLHIIAHTVKSLLGDAFHVIPASLVGEDDVGRRLLDEMEHAGLDTRFMQSASQAPTLFSLCFLYPDGTGGNLTTSNSAASLVDAAFIERLRPEFESFKGEGIALAAPEVPLPARQRLLELGSEYGFFRAASLTALEAASQEVIPLLQKCDLLALNLGEAASLGSALAHAITPEGSPEAIIQALLARLGAWGCRPLLSVTAGKQGSWLWTGSELLYQAAVMVSVANTAGAGDAHFSALLAGVAAGLSLPACHQLAVLVASLKITHPHTLIQHLSPGLLLDFTRDHMPLLLPEVSDFLLIRRQDSASRSGSSLGDEPL